MTDTLQKKRTHREGCGDGRSAGSSGRTQT